MRKVALLLSVVFFVPLLATAFLVASSSEANAAVDVVCFNDLFERTIGQPRHEHSVFPAMAGPATVKVYNGDRGRWLDRAMVANVIINEKVIFRASDFNKRVKYLEKQVNLLEGENSIDVNLMGLPGVRLRVVIEQGMKAEAAAVVGPEGGILEVVAAESPLYGIRIEIPRDSVNQNKVFSIAVSNSPHDPLIDAYDIMPIFELSPSNTWFNQPVEITFPLKDDDNDGFIDLIGIPKENVIVYSSPDGEELWEPVEIVDLNDAANRITASFRHFSNGRISAANSSSMLYNLPSAMYKAFYDTDNGSFNNTQELDDFIKKCQKNGIELIIVEAFIIEDGTWKIVFNDNTSLFPSLRKFDMNYLISKASNLTIPIKVYASINCFNPDPESTPRIDPDNSQHYERIKNEIIPYFLNNWQGLSGIYLDRIRYGHSDKEPRITAEQKQKLTNLVREISQQVWTANRRIGAFTQPGRLGGENFNGQVLADMVKYLDFISPMSYQDSNQANSYSNTFADTKEVKDAVSKSSRGGACWIAPILNTYDWYEKNGSIIEVYSNTSFKNAILGAIEGGAAVLEYFTDEKTDDGVGASGEWKIICKNTTPGVEVCGNGIDDDCNGLVDGEDPDCQQNSQITLLFDNFNSENGGVATNNYSSFTNWNVASGSVDLTNGQGGDGMFVDLDGSTGQNGTLTSKQNFVFESGKRYTLSFSLAASPNISSSTVYVQVASGALLNETITRYTQVLYGDPIFADYSYTFFGDGTSGHLSFTDGGSGDNTGMYLDNVKLAVINP